MSLLSQTVDNMKFYNLDSVGGVKKDADCAQVNGIVSITKEGHYPVAVAIKVLHPHVLQEITADLYVMEKFAKLILFLKADLKWADPVRCLNEFKIVLQQQVDMIYEAENLKKFANHFKHEHQIGFPTVYFASQNVLIESFEEGITMKDFVNTSKNSSQTVKTYLAETGVKALLKMIFRDNFVHADLHPGNIIIQPIAPRKPTIWDRILQRLTNTPFHMKEEYKLVFVDVGMAVTLTPNDLDNFRSVFGAIVEGEGYKVGDLMLRHSPYQDCPNPQLFKEQVAELVQSVTARNIALKEVDVSRLLSDLFSLIAYHRVQVDPTFTCLVLAVMILEGLGRFLDPQLDLLNCAKPFVLNIVS